MAALVWLLASFVGARVADAYIDPGTVGPMLSGWVAPIIGMIGIMVVSTLVFLRGYVRLVFVVHLKRFSMWLLILAAGLLVGAAVFFLRS